MVTQSRSHNAGAVAKSRKSQLHDAAALLYYFALNRAFVAPLQCDMEDRQKNSEKREGGRASPEQTSCGQRCGDKHSKGGNGQHASSCVDLHSSFSHTAAHSKVALMRKRDRGNAAPLSETCAVVDPPVLPNGCRQIS